MIPIYIGTGFPARAAFISGNARISPPCHPERSERSYTPCRAAMRIEQMTANYLLNFLSWLPQNWPVIYYRKIEIKSYLQRFCLKYFLLFIFKPFLVFS
jgi:hypothetical protein